MQSAIPHTYQYSPYLSLDNSTLDASFAHKFLNNPNSPTWRERGPLLPPSLPSFFPSRKWGNTEYGEWDPTCLATHNTTHPGLLGTSDRSRYEGREDGGITGCLNNLKGNNDLTNGCNNIILLFKIPKIIMVNLDIYILQYNLIKVLE